MELNDFVARFADLFEDTDPTEITVATRFQELDEWDSLAALNVIALAKTACGKTITGREIRGCDSVEALFRLIESK